MAYTDFPVQNQLQFNLNVPLKVKNLAIQHHKIQPVVIQRGNQLNGGFTRQQSGVLDQSNISNGSFQFKSVSEDRMAMAIQMAKRDLKSKKVLKAKSRSPSPKSSKTRVIHGKEQRKWQQRQKKPVSGRERNAQTRSVRTQSRPQSPKPFLNTRATRLPVTTNSPPTRDTDIYPRHKVREDLQPTDDIERLQLEMEGYLEQIKTMEQKAMHDPDLFLHRSRSKKKDGYLSDEEDEHRRVIRSEEYSVRAARNLYNLRQQVRQIQRELMSLGSDSRIKQTKKSQAMNKLAAAHRGASRAIQAFVSSLPHQDLRSGLPSSYQELSLLIRQLTQLSSQIKQGQDSQVQRELVNMLDNVDELSDAWQREVRLQRDANRVSPPRKRSPVGRQLFDRDDVSRAKQFKSFQGQNKENKPKGVLKKTVKQSRHQPISKNRSRPVSRSPERQATLRAGIAALMRDRDPSLEARPRPGVTWNISLDDRPAEKKGLLLPAKLQMKRERMHRSHPQPSADSHFADPTIAANLKAVLPLHNPMLDDSRVSSAPSSPGYRRSQSHSPSGIGSRRPWRPPGTPTKSPGTPGKQRSRSFSPAGSRLHFFEEDIESDIVKKLFSDDESQDHVMHHNRERMRKSRTDRSPMRAKSPRSMRSPLRNRSPRPTRRQEPLRNSFVSSVVEEAKKRMKPFLKKGAASYPGYNPRRKSPSPDMSSSFHDDSVGSELLEDILADTVKDLQDREQRGVIHKKAAAMRDAPTLEGLFNRLEEMEEEQQQIRRRWATINYENEDPVSKLITKKDVMSERPRSPPAIHVQRVGNTDKPRHVKFSQQAPEEAIVFTKESKPSQFKTNLTYKVPSNPEEREPVTLPRSMTQPRTLLTIPQSVVSRITDSQERYTSHLKKMSHHPHGVFQPWNLVEEISDEILRECFQEVNEELDDLNSVIANHLYKAEFMDVKSQTPSPESRVSAAGSFSSNHADHIRSDHVRDYADHIRSDDHTDYADHVRASNHGGYADHVGSDHRRGYADHIGSAENDEDSEHQRSNQRHTKSDHSFNGQYNNGGTNFRMHRGDHTSSTDQMDLSDSRNVHGQNSNHVVAADSDVFRLVTDKVDEVMGRDSDTSYHEQPSDRDYHKSQNNVDSERSYGERDVMSDKDSVSRDFNDFKITEKISFLDLSESEAERPSSRRGRSPTTGKSKEPRRTDSQSSAGRSRSQSLSPRGSGGQEEGEDDYGSEDWQTDDEEDF